MYTNYFEKVKEASRSLSGLSDQKSAAVLSSLSKALLNAKQHIIDSNVIDLKRMNPENPKYDRLKLTEERIENMANDLLNVAQLPCPVGEKIEKKTLPNDLKLAKIRVPLGVIGVIYEARPNVTIDVFALCLRSGNACLLKGGSDAESSNSTLVNIIRKVLTEHNCNPDIVQLLPPDRQATDALLAATGYVDVIIPRGSQSLINSVRDKAKLPVIETGAGIVHTYYDESADLELGKKVIYNAKTRRVSVCNALDCLIIHKNRLADLPILVQSMAQQKVELFADTESFKQLKNTYPSQLLNAASPEDFGTEFLSYKMSIKTVNDMNEALDHIYTFSSKHSEAIISNDKKIIERFLIEVDAAAVYVNTSTAFTDGGQFGLGAEIGISTQKLHARGPMGLKELTTYKWIIRGTGQVRPT